MRFGGNLWKVYSTLDCKSLICFVNKKISRYESMNKSYDEIRLCLYIFRSLLVILTNDHQPTLLSIDIKDELRLQVINNALNE
jgi:hypothetical protein